METQLLNLATPSITSSVLSGMGTNLLDPKNFVANSFHAHKNSSSSFITYNIPNSLYDNEEVTQSSVKDVSLHGRTNKDRDVLNSFVRHNRSDEMNTATNSGDNGVDGTLTTYLFPRQPKNVSNAFDENIYNSTLVNSLWSSPQTPHPATDRGNNSTAISGNYIIIFSTLFFLVGTVGITGNVLVVYIVLSDGKMRRSMTNMMILNLALADSLIMLFGVPEIVMFMLDRGWQLGAVACAVNRTILVCALYASVLTLVAVSIERYIAIVFPIKAHILCTKKRVVFVIGFIWLLSSACSSPTAIFNTVVQMSKAKYCITKFHDNRTKHDIYLRIFKYTESALFYMGPLVIQVVCYAVIGKRLFVDLDKLHRGGGGISSASRPHGRGRTRAFNEAVRARKGVVKMLMASVAIYFLSYSPHQILLIYRTFSSLSFDETWMYLVFTTTLAYMNSAANPFLYCVFSDNFRSNFKRILHRCLPCVFCCGDCSSCVCCKDQKTQRPMTLHSYTEYTSLVRRNTPKQGQSPIIAV